MVFPFHAQTPTFSKEMASTTYFAPKQTMTLHFGYQDTWGLFWILRFFNFIKSFVNKQLICSSIPLNFWRISVLSSIIIFSLILKELDPEHWSLFYFRSGAPLPLNYKNSECRSAPAQLQKFWAPLGSTTKILSAAPLSTHPEKFERRSTLRSRSLPTSAMIPI